MFKKQLTPLTKGGSVQAHKGKGSQQAPMPDRSQIKQLATSGGLNDYAKATPMAQPMPGPTPGGGF